MAAQGKVLTLEEQESGRFSVYAGSIPCGSRVRPHSQHLSRRHLRRRGVVMVWVALLIFVMILFVGLSLDTAKVALNIHQLQNAADAAALAGALRVKTQSPTATLQQTANIGFANAVDFLPVTLRTTLQPDPFAGNTAPYDIILGRWVIFNRTFIPTLNAPTAVKVIARRNTTLAPTAPALGLIFGPIAGVNTADANAVAIAFCNSSGGAGLIVLSPSAVPGLHVTGTANVNIDGGGIHVNATAIGNNSSDGAWISNNAKIDAGFLNVVGGVTPDPTDPAWAGIFANVGLGGFPVMDYTQGIQHINDPLAAQMVFQGDPYIDLSTTPPGTRLDLPTHLEGGTNPVFPTRYVKWDSSTSTYDFNHVPGDPCDTVGLGSDIIIDPNTGLPILDPITGFPTYSTGNKSVTVALPPGYYPNGMTIQNGDNITLDPTLDPSVPPIYIVGGGQGPGNNNIGIYMTGGTLRSLNGGVTCYVTQTFDSTGAPLPVPVAGLLRITGGVLDLDSPGDWTNQQPGAIYDHSLIEGLNGIAIWQDPLIPGPPDAHLNGNGNFRVSGTIYFPDPIHARLEGDLGDTGNQILCGSADMMGTADIRVNYDGRNHGFSPVHCYLVD